jgi:tRNA pseudouridine38-40 synthase
MLNLKCQIEYDGTDYAGWQRQPQNPHQRTIQGELEKVFAEILQEEIEVIGAGRTDSGVHAKGQVANLKTHSAMTIYKLLYGANRLLPKGIVITSMEETTETFNARFDAKARTYRYFIITKPSAIKQRFAAFYPPLLLGVKQFDTAAMNRCAEKIIGKQDFTSFSKVHAQAKTRICTVRKAQWRERWQNGEQHLMFEITADRFLHTMVRLLVGTMIHVGAGKLSSDEFQNILDARNVDEASFAAHPEGLFLWKVDYTE